MEEVAKGGVGFGPDLRVKVIGSVRSAVPTEEEGGVGDLACLESHPVLPKFEAYGVLPTAIRAAASGRDADDERLLSCTRAEVHRVPKPVVRLDVHLVKDYRARIETLGARGVG